VLAGLVLLWSFPLQASSLLLSSSVVASHQLCFHGLIAIFAQVTQESKIKTFLREKIFF
jgi:hypothetical protein